MTLPDTRIVQQELDMRLNKSFVNRVDRFLDWEQTRTGLRVRACLSDKFNLGEAQEFADLFENYGTKEIVEENLPEFVVEFGVIRPDVIRVRTTLTPDLADSPFDDVFVEFPEEPPSFTVEDTGGEIMLKTESLDLLVRRRTWGRRGIDSDLGIMSYCVRDRHGRVVLEEIIDEKSIYFGYFAPPLGRAEIDGRDWTVQSFLRHDDEDFYGFGEQFTDFSKRGREVAIWNADAGNCMGYMSYKNVPFFVSTRGYAMMLASPVQAVFDMGSKTAAAWTLKVRGPRLDYFVMVGDTPKKLLRTYYDLTGAPALPPRWSFGLWMSSIQKYQNQQALIDATEEIRSHNLPCDVLHIDPTWMDVDSLVCDLKWGGNVPHPQNLTSTLRERGFKLSLWMSAYVPAEGEMFEEGRENDYFLKDADGNLIVNPGCMNFWSAPFVYVDFTNPDAADWYKERCKRVLQDGAALLKTDLCELGPEEAVYHNGMVGYEGHNFFTREFGRVAYEAGREVHGEEAMIWCRSGTVGSQCNPVHWAGDVRCNFDSMLGQLRAILGAGMSGFVFFSHDIGGFQGTAWPELYIRWFQLGMFTSHARAHGGPDHEPWAHGAEAERICLEFDKLRYSLMPYIYSSAVECCREGLPMLRALILEYPEDRNVRHICDEYLFGPDLLVAPVFENGARSRSVYLPEGEWLDWWCHDVLAGPRWIEADAPLDRIPLYVRRGAIIPRIEPQQHLTEGELWENLQFDIFPDEAGSVRVYRTAQECVEYAYSLEADGIKLTCDGTPGQLNVRVLPLASG